MKNIEISRIEREQQENHDEIMERYEGMITINTHLPIWFQMKEEEKIFNQNMYDYFMRYDLPEMAEKHKRILKQLQEESK